MLRIFLKGNVESAVIGRGGGGCTCSIAHDTNARGVGERGGGNGRLQDAFHSDTHR